MQVTVAGIRGGGEQPLGDGGEAGPQNGCLGVVWLLLCGGVVAPFCAAWEWQHRWPQDGYVGQCACGALGFP